MSPGLIAQVKELPWEEVLLTLRLMADTLPSSWEFVHLTFLIEDVTRAFTHQLVRTRTASYAQQAMRVVNMSGFSYDTPDKFKGNRQLEAIYTNTMADISRGYQSLVKLGAENEDARGVLPTNVLTNINMSINMRNWINLIRKRSSARIQNEYRHVVEQMIIEVEKVYPWIYIFVKNDELKARKDLQDMIYANEKLTTEEKVNMVKKLDIIIKDV
jgi:flavin-dependent thymidylate synthase